MKKAILSSFFAVTLLFANPFSSNACESGGPGATSCSASATTEIMGVGMEVSVSVSCGSGYYACCNNSGFTASASCVGNQ